MRPAQAQLDTPAPDTQPIQRFLFQEQLLDFNFTLELYSPQEQQARQLAQKIWATLKTQAYALRPAALKQLVKSAERQPVILSDNLRQFLETQLKYFQLSQGALDPTAAPLYNFWGFVPESLAYRIPTPAEWQQLRSRIDASALQIQAQPPSLRITRPGLALNLHPGLQGFLIDQVTPLLKRSGLPAAALSTREVGYYLGVPPGAQAWKIAMPNPQRSGQVFAYLYLSNQALAQINTLNHRFSQRGLDYHDLLDVRTGQPTQEGLAVSIRQSSALEAELIAHLLIRMNDLECQSLLPRLPALQALKLVSRNGMLIPLEYHH